MDVLDVQYYGFTSKKRDEQNNILYYNNKTFNSDYAKYNWMKSQILEWTKDCEYIATEDYAYGKSGALGQIFSLAEFEGNIKLAEVERGQKMRLYSVNSNKKFFSGYGLSDKSVCEMRLIIGWELSQIYLVYQRLIMVRE